MRRIAKTPTFKAIEEELTISAATQCLAATTTLESLIQNKDEEYVILRATIQNTNIPPINRTTAPFKKIWSDLSLAENGLILLKARRIVIPNSKIKDILKSLHSSHAGVTRTMKRTHQLYYWPGMAEDIKKMIDNCRPCQELRPAQPRNPPKLTPTAKMVPMQHVGTDLFFIDREDHLVLVDRYSGFVVSKLLNSTSTTSITYQFKMWFDVLG